MDIVAAATGLVVLSPLLVVTAVAIKLDTRGPVFFRQPRIGQGGKRFSMFKFRSMVQDAEQIKGDLLERNEAEGVMAMNRVQFQRGLSMAELQFVEVARALSTKRRVAYSRSAMTHGSRGWVDCCAEPRWTSFLSC